MRKSRLNSETQLKLIRCFVEELSVRNASEIASVNKNTVYHYYQRLRTLIAEKVASQTYEVFNGAIEIDQNYINNITYEKLHTKGIKGKAILGIIVERQKIYTKEIPNNKILNPKNSPIITLLPDGIIFFKDDSEATKINFDNFNNYQTIYHKELGIVPDRINLIEKFTDIMRKVFVKFNSVDRRKFQLITKECEWRFNMPDREQQLSMLEQWVQRANN